jgi:hypothetical protein
MKKKVTALILTIAIILTLPAVLSSPASPASPFLPHHISQALEILRHLAKLEQLPPDKLAVYEMYDEVAGLTIGDAMYVLRVLAKLTACKCVPEAAETTAVTIGTTGAATSTTPTMGDTPSGQAQVELLAREAVDWRTRPPEVDGGDGPFRSEVVTVTGDGTYSATIDIQGYASLVGFGLYSAGTVFDPWDNARDNAVKPDSTWTNARIGFDSVTANGGSIVLGTTFSDVGMISGWLDGFIHIPLWNGWWADDNRLTGVTEVTTGTAVSFGLPGGIPITSIEVTFTVTGTGRWTPSTAPATTASAPVTTATPPPKLERPDVPHGLVNPPVLGDCRHCGEQGILCRADGCGYCADCDWELQGVIHCTSCLRGTDCLAQAGTDWCGACFVCGDCCDCGSTPRAGWDLNHVHDCVPCGESSFGCTGCGWCADCNWSVGIVICPDCSRCGSCLYRNGARWVRDRHRCDSC